MCGHLRESYKAENVGLRLHVNHSARRSHDDPPPPPPPSALTPPSQLQELPRQPFVFVPTPYSLSAAVEHREIIGMWAFERSLRGKMREELRDILAFGSLGSLPNADESTYEKDEADGSSRHILGRSASSLLLRTLSPCVAGCN